MENEEVKVEPKVETPNSMYNENNKPEPQAEPVKVEEPKTDPLTNDKLNQLIAEMQKLQANQQVIINQTSKPTDNKGSEDDVIKY